METLVLTLDTIAVMVICYFSYKGEKAPGQPELGPFRIRSFRKAPDATAPTESRARPRLQPRSQPVRRR